MKLAEVQKLASKGYADGDGMTDYFNPDTGIPTEWTPGDSLEWFMHREIADTFDPDANDDDQIYNAVNGLEQAQKDLQGAIDSLLEGVKANAR